MKLTIEVGQQLVAAVE